MSYKGITSPSTRLLASTQPNQWHTIGHKPNFVQRIKSSTISDPPPPQKKKKQFEQNMQDFKAHKELKRNIELSLGLPPTLKKLTKSMLLGPAR